VSRALYFSEKAMIRTLLLLLLSVPAFAIAESYPANFEQVSKKYEQQGFQSLSEKEVVIYTVWWLEAEVNNGGFHQYLWNSAGNYASEALTSLQKVGANYTASLLTSAINAAYDGNLPESRYKRQELLETNQGIKIKKLQELDNKFYAYTENFYQKINLYLAK